MLKAIIFDMDGVIIDSEPQHARSALEVFQGLGIDTDLAYCTSFIGSSTRKMAEETIARFSLEETTDSLLEKLTAAKRHFLAKEGYQPLPGVIDLIKLLSKKGYKLAIASSSSLTEIEHTVKALNIRKYFSHFISSTKVNQPKPAPDIFLQALKELGINANEAIVIEDSAFGVMAAKSAKIGCVGYINPNSGHQDLSEANVLLESFEGITDSFFEHIWQRSQGLPVTIGDTRRLVIRELTEKDIPDLYPIYQDPDVRKYIENIDEFIDAEMEKQRAYIKNVYSFYGYGLWGVFSKTTQGLIGRCGIENQVIDGQNEFTLSYLLDSNHWGYGYAIECCTSVLQYAREELNIHRVVAVIDVRNERSIQTAKNLNMVQEKEFVHNGRPCYLFALQM